MYLDIYEVVSHNCLFNMLVGNRGGGKTYGFKQYAIDQFIKYGTEFGYVRRYKTDLKDSGDNAIGTFFDDIRDRYPDHELEVKGTKFFIDKKYAGKAFALSTAANKKSVAYPKMANIGYDEFLLNPDSTQHFLKNEPQVFLELYETIARHRPNVRAFFMANSTSISNPWFAKFKVVMPYNTKVWKKQNKELSRQGVVNGILLQLVADPEFIEMKKGMAIYDLIKDTTYADYSIDNKFLLDNKNFVMKKTPKSEHSFSLSYNDNLLGVWVDYSAGLLFVSKDIDPYCPAVYAVTTNDHKPNTMLLKRSRQIQHIRFFLDNYQMGNVRFESINVKNLTQQIIDLTF